MIYPILISVAHFDVFSLISNAACHRSKESEMDDSEIPPRAAFHHQITASGYIPTRA